MKNIFILHPYRATYTDILECISEKHHYVLLIDEAKQASFAENLPNNVELITVACYQNNCREEAENILKSHNIDAIIALDEFDIILASELREKYCIQGQGKAEATIFRDKKIMIQRVKELGFDVPESQVVSSLSEVKEFLNRYQDIIVKPLSGAGSVNTFRVQSIHDISKLAIDAHSYQKQFIVQNYLDSEIYHIDGFLSNGEIIYCEPSKYLYNPLLIKQGISAAAISLDYASDDYKKLVDYASLLTKKLCPNGTFLFHLEVFYDLNHITFLEIACRMGGARIRQNLEYKLSINPIKLLIDSISGDELPELANQHQNTGWLLTAKKAGTISALPLLTDKMKQDFSIFDYVEYVKVGQKLNKAYHSADAVIGLSLWGKSFEETKRKLLSVEKLLLKYTRYS